MSHQPPLQDPLPSSTVLPPTALPKFRPYASPTHRVTKGRYITSNDPRGYIPVYEYPLNGQWIMMDIDDGYILWTGIWKALGNAKADIVKMLESQPDLASQLRRVRGGYLKIQGTWMPYEVALRLARRVAWPIRDDLVPLFGPTFPTTCLSPGQPGYGQVVNSASGKRRARRNFITSALASSPFQASGSRTTLAKQRQQPLQQQASSGLFVLSAAAEAPNQHVHGQFRMPTTTSVFSPPSQFADTMIPHRHRYLHPAEYQLSDAFLPNAEHPEGPQGQHRPGLLIPAFPHATYGQHAPPSASGSGGVTPTMGPPGSPSAHSPPTRTRTRSASVVRYAPYGPPPRARSFSSVTFPPIDLPPIPPAPLPTPHGGPGVGRRFSGPLTAAMAGPIRLAPIRAADAASSSSRFFTAPSHQGAGAWSLPPISSMDERHRSASPSDSAAVLRRLTIDDDVLGLSHRRPSAGDDGDGDSEPTRPTQEQLWTRRRSLSAPPFNPEAAQMRPPPWSVAASSGRIPRHHRHGQDSRRLAYSQHARGGLSSVSSSSTHDDRSSGHLSPVTPTTPSFAIGSGSEGEAEGRSAIYIGRAAPSPLPHYRDTANERGHTPRPSGTPAPFRPTGPRRTAPTAPSTQSTSPVYGDEMSRYRFGDAAGHAEPSDPDSHMYPGDGDMKSPSSAASGGGQGLNPWM